jgi:hypothetical protein
MGNDGQGEIMMRAITVTVIGVSLLVFNIAAADVGLDPPVVQIVDLSLVDVEALAVDVDESFSLIGLATGAIPLYYFWLCDFGEGSVVVATGQYLLDYAFAASGVYVLTLEVVDAYDQSGYDSVVVTVSDGPVANEPATWSAVKALYE